MNQKILQAQKQLTDLQSEIQKINQVCSDRDIRAFGDPAIANRINQLAQDYEQQKKDLEAAVSKYSSLSEKITERRTTLQELDQDSDDRLRERIQRTDPDASKKILKRYAEIILADRVASNNTHGILQEEEFQDLSDNQKLVLSDSLCSMEQRHTQEKGELARQVREVQLTSITDLKASVSKIGDLESQVQQLKKAQRTHQEDFKKAQRTHEQKLKEAQRTHAQNLKDAERLREEDLRGWGAIKDQLDSEIKKLKEAQLTHNQELRARDTEKSQLESGIQELGKQLDKTRREHEKQLETRDTQRNQLESEFDALEEQLEETRREHEKQLETRDTQRSQLQSEFDALKEQLEETRREHEKQLETRDTQRSQLQSEITRLQEQLEESDKKFTLLSQVLAESQKLAEKCQNDARDAKRDKTTAELLVQGLRNQAALDKATIESKQDEISTLTKEREADAATMGKQHDTINTCRSEKLKAEEDLRSSKRQLGELTERNEQLAKDMERLEHITKDLRGQVERLQSTKSQLKSQIQDIEHTNSSTVSKLVEEHKAKCRELTTDHDKKLRDQQSALDAATAAVQNKEGEVQTLRQQLNSTRRCWQQTLAAASAIPSNPQDWQDFMSSVEGSAPAMTDKPSVKVWGIDINANVQHHKSSNQRIIELFAAFCTSSWTTPQVLYDIYALSAALSDQSVIDAGMLAALVRIAARHVHALQVHACSKDQFAVAFGVSQLLHVIQCRWPNVHRKFDASCHVTALYGHLDEMFSLSGSIGAIVEAPTVDSFALPLTHNPPCLVRGHLAIMAVPTTDFILVFNIRTWCLVVEHKSECSLELTTYRIGNVEAGNAVEVPICSQIVWFLENAIV